MASDSERQAMRRAIELAGRHRPHPNPRVGAVILASDGTTVASGAHRGPGSPHAEIVALADLAGVADGDTMVVTLEPCDHHGLTPPCTEALIAAGIRRVVVGAIDPDTRVAGTGLERLRAAGIDVEAGVLAGEVEGADPAYFHHRRLHRAHLTAKVASTLDGQTAAADGTSQWITSPEARTDAHRLRAAADAVMVGAGTLRRDDPLLTVRVDGYDDVQPTAVVVAGRQPLPGQRRLWERPNTLVFATADHPAPVPTVVVPSGPTGLPDLAAIVVELGDRGLLSVLVEGGAGLLGSLWAAGLIDAGVTYLAAKLAGGSGAPAFTGTWKTLGDAADLVIEAVTVVGPDVRLDWRPATSGGEPRPLT